MSPCHCPVLRSFFQGTSGGTVAHVGATHHAVSPLLSSPPAPACSLTEAVQQQPVARCPSRAADAAASAGPTADVARRRPRGQQAAAARRGRAAPRRRAIHQLSGWRRRAGLLRRRPARCPPRRAGPATRWPALRHHLRGQGWVARGRGGSGGCWPATPVAERGGPPPHPPFPVIGQIKLALPAGKANPAPPVGPALGSKARAGARRLCARAPTLTQHVHLCRASTSWRSARSTTRRRRTRWGRSSRSQSPSSTCAAAAASERMRPRRRHPPGSD